MSGLPSLPPTALRLERLLPAPIADVFTAWTSPALMAQWLTPIGHAEVEADVRVGGRFRVTMIDGDVRLEHTGEYLVVDPPHRLSFTWLSPYTGGQPSRVDVSLSARGSETLLVLSHLGLPGETRSSHEGGWFRILERLSEVVAHETSRTTTSKEGVS